MRLFSTGCPKMFPEGKESLCVVVSPWCQTPTKRQVVVAVCYAPNPPESITSFCGFTVSMLT